MHRKAEAWRESTMRGLDVIDRKNHQIEQLEASLEGRTTKLAEAERELAALVMLLKELGTPS